MSLRSKLAVFTIIFFLITAALISGSFLIFNRLSANFAAQKSIVMEHSLHEDWKASIVSVVMAAEGWGVTGDAKFQRQYKQKLKSATGAFNNIPEALRDKKEVRAIKTDFDKMIEFANAIMASKEPVGDVHVLFALRMLQNKEREIYEKLDAVHSEAVTAIGSGIAEGERIERQMGFYFVILFGISSIAFMSLVIFMRKIVTAPFDDLLKATEKITGGELNYRIDTIRKDEFGIIAKRFDEMVEKLQQSIISNAELYETAQLREKQAREGKKRMETLFESVQGGIITIGREYEIISVNKFFEAWTDIDAEEITGQNVETLFHGKDGICPHCVAQVTFETGQINSITQSQGMNYAELTSYPIKDSEGKVIECVVFIEDITDRMLYHEEILGLYKEVAQTKEYLESLIENSADAIVTSDLNGNITSWNYGAERTFGCTEDEAIGKFLPFIPDFLIDAEKEQIGRIKNGETLKDIETLRQKKDGTIIEASVTLSPVKDAAGEVIGISGITRDISGRKRVERELIRRNQELSRLFFISSAMRGTLELDRLLRMILTAVTMSDGLGFNRALLFLVDEKKEVIKGAMGVGPANPEEAWKIWEKLSIEKKTLPDILYDIETGPLRKDSFLDKLSMGMEVSLKDDTILTRSVKAKKAFNVLDVKDEAVADAVLIQQLGTQAYAVVPLISRDRVIGVLWVDNIFTRRLISDEDMKFLSGFSNQVASAVESARLFDHVARAEAELENIFKSISDMVYITDKDYTIKNVNKAVVDRTGKSAGELIGAKCYKVFHGLDEPFPECPHHKTVQTREAYVEEVEDPYLGGTFLTSVSPVFNQVGEFLGTVHVVRDITELNSLREKLVATERMAALGEVAAKVAHEIRNPLVSVGGFAKRLEKKLDGNLKEYAGIIAKEVERLEGILREILGFVKEARLLKEKVNAVELIDDVIQLIQTQLRERDIKLIKSIGDTPAVYIDPNRVKEALLNIVNNAVQAVAIHGTITMKTYTDAGYAVLEINDTGPGIEEKNLPFIFNPFYTTKLSGTGLGLAITKRIIEEHKGRIEVDSKVGKGTTFRVFLPG